MKAILPAMFFATLGVPVGTVCAILLALIVFLVINDKTGNAEDDGCE